MKDFEYFAPKSLDEALTILVRYRGEARPIAGGTDLLVQMKQRRAQPRCVVNLKRIPGLRGIVFDPETGLRLGALTTLSDIIRSEVIRQHYPVLAYTASRMAGNQIRNLATVGGNLCNASPAADTAPPLIALNATAHIAGPGGVRTISLENFFLGPGRTVLAPDELLVELHLPPPLPAQETRYQKLEYRQAMDIAVVGVAASVRRRATGNGPACEDARIVLGAVAPTPLRARRSEDLLRGHTVTEDLLVEAGHVAAEEAKPIDDVRGSAWYRRQMVAVLTRRVLREVLAG